MKTMKHTHYGFTVLYAVLTAAVVLVIALSVSERIVRDLTLSSSTRESQRAIFAADAALECTLYWDIKHDGYSRSVFGSYGNSVSPSTLLNGLVAYWPMNDGEGSTVAVDTAGNNNGILQNMDQNDAWVPAHLGFGLDFDGGNDFVEVPDAESLRLNGDMSFSFWINFDAYPTSWTGILSKFASGSATEFYMRLRDANTGQFIHSKADGSLFSWGWTPSVNTPLGEWVHVVGVRDFSGDNRMRLYFNGVEWNSGKVLQGQGLTTNAPVTIGRHANETIAPSASEVNGQIDDVRLYNRALSEEEVVALYQQGTLIGHWPMNESEGFVANDSSLANNDGALDNFTEPVAWEDGLFGNALHFNESGNDDDETVIIPNEELYDLSEYTYAFWVNPTTFSVSDPRWRGLFTKGAGTGAVGTQSPEMRLLPSSMAIRVWQDVASGGVELNDRISLDSPQLDANDWNHVAFVSTGDAGELRFYIDGNFTNSVSHSYDLVPNNFDLTLAKGYGTLGNDIIIDDFRVYSRALTDDEIEGLAGGVPPFNEPIDPGADTGVECAEAVITNASTGWDPVNGWDIELDTAEGEDATITYDVQFPNGTCAEVEVQKIDGQTIIDSRGYNTCDDSSPRRVERGLRATY